MFFIVGERLSNLQFEIGLTLTRLRLRLKFEISVAKLPYLIIGPTMPTEGISENSVFLTVISMLDCSLVNFSFS